MKPTGCEEDIRLTADEGYGYFPARPGGKLNGGRYKVIRKLGFGEMSTTWLAEDQQRKLHSPRYVAIKIATVYATLNSQELAILREISGLGDERDRLPLLWDHFEETGPHGNHHCLVLDVFSTDITSFRLSAPNKRLPVHLVKLLIAQIAEALGCLHSLGFIHTDLKGRNVLFGTPMLDTYDIERQYGPTAAAIEEVSIGQHAYHCFPSQPIRHTFCWDSEPSLACFINVVLTDFSNAFRGVSAPNQDVISPYALRAPEVILKAGLSPKVDIWMVGFVAFELLTGHWLFQPKAGETWSREEEHLAQMVEITGDDFGSLLTRSAARDKFFDAEGRFLHIPDLTSNPLEDALEAHGLPEEEAVPAAAFIRNCLRLDPTKRASAEDLQVHNWLKSAYGG